MVNLRVIKQATEMKRILVPYDFSKVSEHALDFACQIADKVGSEIMLLNVIEHPDCRLIQNIGNAKCRSNGTAVHQKDV